MSKTQRFIYDSTAKARQQRKNIDNGVGVRHIPEKNATTAWEWCMSWSPLPCRCGTFFDNVPHSHAVVNVLWPPKNLDNGVGVRHIRGKNATTAWEWCMSWSPLPRRCGTFFCKCASLPSRCQCFLGVNWSRLDPKRAWCSPDDAKRKNFKDSELVVLLKQNSQKSFWSKFLCYQTSKSDGFTEAKPATTKKRPCRL